MHFDRPSMFHLLWTLLPGIVFFYMWASARKEKLKARFGNLELLGRMSSTTSKRRQRWKIGFIITGVVFLIIALAQPQFGAKLKKVQREGQDIIIALDVSLSMLAEDLKPNRLERAKRAISGLIDLMHGDRVGLVVFAGKSFTECPLTTDYNAAKLFLNIINTDIIPVPGTAIGSAITTASKAFIQKERKHKVLILLTDGEDHVSNPVAAAKEAAEQGIRIYTVGIGRQDGVPIPIKDRYGNITGHKRDRNGNVVITRLDETTLEKIAFLSNGKYYRSTLGENELQKIYADIGHMEKKRIKGREFTQYEDRYQFFVFIALIFFALESLVSDRKRSKHEWKGRFL